MLILGHFSLFVFIIIFIVVKIDSKLTYYTISRICFIIELTETVGLHF